ncbi:recombinase family protein [Sphingomonas sp. H160509]|uniref:recombinase family protein n=1 Tax=Sphingomonas sp. H160509 TaxID=2955313 RepID=UPI00209775D0|nr:recombinase family protein [Sphingomonas sp. H160509]MDD1452680.1 recombinase family protein [Sphingomonas sp. H160509]
MLAIAYARWSSMEQTKGSTLARQIEATTSLIESRGWEPIGDPLIDRGKSAYTGANIETGQLGQFRDSIMSGARDACNLVLVVEELDRLSRQPADLMLSWLSPLVRKGLSIAVVNTGQMITRDMLDTDMGGLMMILITAFGSHTESRKKSTRVAAAWEQKREAARNGDIAKVQRNHRRPKWVEIAEDGSFFVPPVKLEIIRLIFENRVAGIGKGLTAKTLNDMARDDSRYATWELDAGERKAPAHWSPTYVGRILANRAVMGEWQPYQRPRSGEVIALEPIADFYPKIIEPALFTRANEARISEALKRQGRGASLSNLLGTRARCATCGGQMAALGSAAYKTNKVGITRRHYSLYCTNAKIAKSCDNVMGWAYDKVEGPILDTILTLAMDDQHFGAKANDTAPLEAAVHTAKASIAETERKIEFVMDAIEGGGGEAAKARLAMRQRELADAKEALDQAEAALSSARGAVSPAEHLKRVGEVRELMNADDPDIRFQARSRVKAALGALIDKITFHPATGIVSVLVVDRARLFSIANATCQPRGGNLRKNAVEPQPYILSDLDFTAMGAGPGYGKVTTIEGGTRKETVSNDLDADQIAASKGYVRRKAATETSKTGSGPK